MELQCKGQGGVGVGLCVWCKRAVQGMVGCQKSFP